MGTRVRRTLDRLSPSIVERIGHVRHMIERLGVSCIGMLVSMMLASYNLILDVLLSPLGLTGTPSCLHIETARRQTWIGITRARSDWWDELHSDRPTHEQVLVIQPRPPNPNLVFQTPTGQSQLNSCYVTRCSKAGVLKKFRYSVRGRHVTRDIVKRRSADPLGPD
jgi:hypothetical protein